MSYQLIVSSDCLKTQRVYKEFATLSYAVSKAADLQTRLGYAFRIPGSTRTAWSLPNMEGFEMCVYRAVSDLFPRALVRQFFYEFPFNTLPAVVQYRKGRLNITAAYDRSVRQISDRIKTLVRQGGRWAKWVPISRDIDREEVAV